MEDETPSAPVKAVEKTSTHTVKRNTDGLAPSKGPVTTGRRGQNVTGNEAGALIPCCGLRSYEAGLGLFC